MLLKIINIDVYYGKAQVLHSVSLSVDEGEIVTLLGANGAGKSTTLKAISGIIHPRNGQIVYKNKAINREKPGAIVKLGAALCPEGRELFSEMSVKDNLRLGAFLRRDFAGIEEDIEGVYGHFPRLRERSRQTAGSLSGGEQQMLAIGRALMSHPQLLMLDEPSLGLSPLLIQEVFRIVKNISEKGTSILLVEQNVVASLEIAHRGYVIETGKITLSGTSHELMNNAELRRAYLGG
jgi:branched-chain amino acid transport system ATP-binding protein